MRSKLAFVLKTYNGCKSMKKIMMYIDLGIIAVMAIGGVIMIIFIFGLIVIRVVTS